MSKFKFQQHKYYIRTTKGWIPILFLLIAPSFIKSYCHCIIMNCILFLFSSYMLFTDVSFQYKDDHLPFILTLKKKCGTKLNMPTHLLCLVILSVNNQGLIGIKGDKLLDFNANMNDFIQVSLAGAENNKSLMQT